MKKQIYIPSNTGKYACGSLLLSFEDNSRRDTLLPEKDIPRKIAVRLYYPCEKSAAEGHEKAELFSKPKAAEIRKAYHADPTKYFNTGDLYENIPFIKGKRFPLIIYNHGYMSCIEANTFLCTELASHGYVIASIEHPFESILTEYPDGNSIPFMKTLSSRLYDGSVAGGVLRSLSLIMAKGSDREIYRLFDARFSGYTFMKERIEEWVKDSLFALSELKKHDIAEITDFSRIGCSGHSFGGATAYRLCMTHPDIFSCGINIDGGLFGDYSGMTMTRPFCQICCGMNLNAVTRSAFGTSAPAYRLIFRDITHLGFTDMKLLLPDMSGLGRLPAKALHKNLCHTHLGFFGRYLKGRKDLPIYKDNPAVIYKEFSPDIKSHDTK